MGGIASFIGGLGDAASRYGEQRRSQLMQQWGVHQANFAKVLEDLERAATTPQRQVDLAALRAKILKLKPGEDPSKLIEEIQQHSTLHPIAERHLTGAQAPPPPPGPAAPGNVPGSSFSSMMSAPPQATQPPSNPLDLTNGLGPVASPGAPPQQAGPPAAQPSASPIQGGHTIQPVQGAPAPAPVNPIMQQYNDALASGSMPPVLANAAQPYITNQAELDRARSLSQFKLSELNNLRNEEGDFTMNPETMLKASALGITLPYAMYGMMRPVHTTEDAATLEQHYPGILSRFDINPKTTPRVIITRTPMDLTGEPINVAGVNSGYTKSTDATGNVNIIPNLPGAAGVTAAQSAPHYLPTAGGGVEVGSAAQARAGQDFTPVAGAVSPSMLGTEHTSIKTVQTVGPDGQPVTQMVPVTTESHKVAPGKPTAGGSIPPVAPKGNTTGPRSFDRSLTPLQTMSENQKLEQYQFAIGRAQRVLKNAHLLDSMIDSGKMQLALEGMPEDRHLTALISRAVKLTPAESQMVTDFNSLRESVNLIRGPLGATGFRGPEAFAALQAQRGNLLGRPDVTKGAIANFINEMQNQVGPIRKALHKDTTGGDGGEEVKTRLLQKYGGH